MEYSHALSAGTVLNGEYKVVRILGSGGFANTYLATDTNLKRDVAIKEYFPAEIAYREGTESVRIKTASYKKNFQWGLDRFKREAQILVKFHHPNIVRVFTTFDANQTTYMVLEFVKGADFEAWLSRLGRRPTQDDLDTLTAPLLEALERVHAQGILHRDIKPANIYIRDEDSTPVLLDFGAARSSIVSEFTGTTAAIVSRGYSPHEAYATDHKLHGPWSDVYGLAATLYRCISGESPPESTGRVLEDTLVSAKQLPNVSRYRLAFLEAIDWGLSVLPKNRPQTVSEWRSRLVQGTETQPLTAPAPEIGFAPSIAKSGSGASRTGLVAGGVLSLAGIATLALLQTGAIDRAGVGSLLRSTSNTRGEAQESNAERLVPKAEVAEVASGTKDASRELEATRAPEKPASRAEDNPNEQAETRPREGTETQAQAGRQTEEAKARAQAMRQAEEGARARAMRQAEEQAKRLAELDAIARAERQAKEADAKRAGAAGAPAQRSELVRRIQAELRDRQCYNGAINGEINDGEAAIRALNAALEREGRPIRKLEIRTASRNKIESWLQWLLQDLDSFRCDRKQAEHLSKPRSPV